VLNLAHGELMLAAYLLRRRPHVVDIRHVMVVAGLSIAVGAMVYLFLMRKMTGEMRCRGADYGGARRWRVASRCWFGLRSSVSGQALVSSTIRRRRAAPVRWRALLVATTAMGCWHSALRALGRTHAPPRARCWRRSAASTCMHSMLAGRYRPWAMAGTLIALGIGQTMAIGLKGVSGGAGGWARHLVGAWPADGGEVLLITASAAVRWFHSSS
jgi:hypothetical protein